MSARLSRDRNLTFDLPRYDSNCMYYSGDHDTFAHCSLCMCSSDFSASHGVGVGGGGGGGGGNDVTTHVSAGESIIRIIWRRHLRLTKV